MVSVLFAGGTILRQHKLLDRVELVASSDVVKTLTHATAQSKLLSWSFFCFCHVGILTHMFPIDNIFDFSQNGSNARHTKQTSYC